MASRKNKKISYRKLNQKLKKLLRLAFFLIIALLYMVWGHHESKAPHFPDLGQQAKFFANQCDDDLCPLFLAAINEAKSSILLIIYTLSDPKLIKALQQKAPDLPNLIRPHMGNGLAGGKSVRMSSLLTSAPELDAKRIDQIAALPLGGRVKVDPWSDQVELAKAKPMAITSAREKMPFEITPFFPYLTRISTGGMEKVASTTPVSEQK